MKLEDKGEMNMTYKIEVNNGKWSLYSPKIEMYVMKDATLEEVKIALATEMEYAVKLDIVKLFMTFPHGYSTMDDKIIARDDAVEEFEAWYKETHPRIVFPEEYHALIDKKIAEAF